MPKHESSSKKDAVSKAPEPAEPALKRRKHGYRGYPNNAGSGDVHWGSGFAGVGSTSSPSGGTGVLTERTKDDAARKDENEDTAGG